jgi:O-antigen/teichoic acid export membrane protein
MTDNEKQTEGEKSESPLNKQMSPLAGGGFLGGLVFAFILYRSHDVLRALLVGGVVFALLFWVMWAGRYLERRSKNKKKDD